MVIVLAALMAAIAFVVLTRLLWLAKRPSKPTAAIALAAVALVMGLGVLAATGRLHWIAAVGAALLPFLRRGFSLLRYAPMLRGLFGAYQNTRADGGDRATSNNSSDMGLDQAREILGLESHPSRDEIIAAHRRLIQKIHPDRGGSNYLAQQLNEAKRTLLKNAP